jgi:hypothetical protein
MEQRFTPEDIKKRFKKKNLYQQLKRLKKYAEKHQISQFLKPSKSGLCKN